jgi:hypothetical protein
MLRKGPANVKGQCVAEFKAAKSKNWTPMSDPTSEDECRKLIAERRAAGGPKVEFRIRHLVPTDVEG